jgi:hypothetical protein
MRLEIYRIRVRVRFPFPLSLAILGIWEMRLRSSSTVIRASLWQLAILRGVLIRSSPLNEGGKLGPCRDGRHQVGFVRQGRKSAGVGGMVLEKERRDT